MTTASENPAIPILYEDNHLLVVVKPPGLPTQSGRPGTPDVLTQLKADLKIRHAKPGHVFLGLVHRLDQPVGGVMVFAKTSKGASRLSAQIRNRQFVKIYWALVDGHPPQPAGTLEHYLLKDCAANRVRIVSPETPGAKYARLHYETIQSTHTSSLLRIQLETGRPHQIRVQCAAMQCPLKGDHKYGRRPSSAQREAIGLWAYAITFTHPTQGHPMSFSAPLPPHLTRLPLFGAEQAEGVSPRNNK